ncbi:MAG: hypothetical protein H0V93_11735 [Euzebyales bacterium]|nr:hypothetical protein [Euzebyales bacterium]
MESVKPSELYTAARVADALVYAVGVAGVIAGGLLFRDGQLGFAVLAWVLVFIGGAMLRLTAWAAKAVAELLVRTQRITEEVSDLRAGAPAGTIRLRDPDAPPDPYGRGRWGGWH